MTKNLLKVALLSTLAFAKVNAAEVTLDSAAVSQMTRMASRLVEVKSVEEDSPATHLVRVFTALVKEVHASKKLREESQASVTELNSKLTSAKEALTAETQKFTEATASLKKVFDLFSVLGVKTLDDFVTAVQTLKADKETAEQAKTAAEQKTQAATLKATNLEVSLQDRLDAELAAARNALTAAEADKATAEDLENRTKAYDKLYARAKDYTDQLTQANASPVLALLGNPDGSANAGVKAALEGVDGADAHKALATAVAGLIGEKKDAELAELLTQLSADFADDAGEVAVLKALNTAKTSVTKAKAAAKAIEDAKAALAKVEGAYKTTGLTAPAAKR